MEQCPALSLGHGREALHAVASPGRSCLEANVGRLRAGVEVVVETKNWSKANLDSVELPFACGM